MFCLLCTDLLAIFWPIFFVMTSRQDPFLKTRNFKKSVAKATETAMNVPAFVACAVTRRKFTANCTSEGNEKIPDWDHPGDSSGNQHVSKNISITAFPKSKPHVNPRLKSSSP